MIYDFEVRSSRIVKWFKYKKHFKDDCFVKPSLNKASFYFCSDWSARALALLDSIHSIFEPLEASSNPNFAILWLLDFQGFHQIRLAPPLPPWRLARTPQTQFRVSWLRRAATPQRDRQICCFPQRLPGRNLHQVWHLRRSAMCFLMPDFDLSQPLCLP